MKIEEVLYLPVKREGFSIITDKLERISHYRTLDGEEVSSSFKAKTKEELLDQAKPVVPKFVADWYEKKKHAFMYFYVRLIVDVYEGRTIGYNQPFIDWVIKTNEAYTILTNMHQFGYEVEKEKLYTVEIPNVYGNDLILRKTSNGVVYIGIFYDKNFDKDKYSLTESEIRENYDWAWQWAKEVGE